MIRMPRISPETAVWSVVGLLAAVLFATEALLHARAFGEMIEAMGPNDPTRTVAAGKQGEPE